MIKMILSDMDETLLVDHQVPQVNRQAVQKALRQGVRFVPATGRSFAMIRHVLRQVGMERQPDTYSICFNGAAIYENATQQLLQFSGISYEQAVLLYQLSKRYSVSYLAFSLERVFIFRPEPSEIERKTRQGADFVICEDIGVLQGQAIGKIALQSADEAYLYEIGEKEAEAFRQIGIEVSYSSGRYLECNAAGVSKGQAMRWLADHLQIPLSEVLAIGDNSNDRSMLQQAGIGVCVASGREEIKAIADVVTDRGYKEGAVAEAIERFV